MTRDADQSQEEASKQEGNKNPKSPNDWRPLGPSGRCNSNQETNCCAAKWGGN